MGKAPTSSCCQNTSTIKPWGFSDDTVLGILTCWAPIGTCQGTHKVLVNEKKVTTRRNNIMKKPCSVLESRRVSDFGYVQGGFWHCRMCLWEKRLNYALGEVSKMIECAKVDFDFYCMSDRQQVIKHGEVDSKRVNFLLSRLHHSRSISQSDLRQRHFRDLPALKWSRRPPPKSLVPVASPIFQVQLFFLPTA